MSKIDVLDLLGEVEREKIVIAYTDMEHVAKHWSLEEKLLYLQGLALVSKVDGGVNEDKKRWLIVLAQAMNMDADQIGEPLEVFTKNPDKETVLAFLDAFFSTTKAQIFLYDALTLNQLNKQASEQGLKVIEKFAEQLKVSKEAWQAIQQLFNQVQEKGIAATQPDEKVLDREQFQHFYEQDTLSSSSGVNTQQPPFLANLGHFVEIPAGSFMMGSNNDVDWERLLHKDTTLKSLMQSYGSHVHQESFLMQEAPVTFAAWDAFVKESGCGYSPDDCRWGRDKRPVINVSYKDITELFLPWLNRVTGKNFRLPSEAEWEYACRAGSTTNYSWGNDINSSQANYGFERGKTVYVKSYSPNAFGLYDMHGNVLEWTQDCWSASRYSGASTDVNAKLEGSCDQRVLRGGSWSSRAEGLRSDARNWGGVNYRGNNNGFRLVQDC